MDITVEQAHRPAEPFIYVRRSLVDLSAAEPVAELELERMPASILSIRAAEYDLEPEDDFVLDLVMLERFAPVEPDEVHPLFSADSVKDALEIMHERVELARVEHGSPKGANRVLAAAVRNGVASQGLADAHRMCIESTDPRLVKPIRYARDEMRERLRGWVKHPVH